MQTHHKYNDIHVTQYHAYGVDNFCSHHHDLVNGHMHVWTDGKTWRAQVQDDKPFACSAEGKEQLASAMLNASSQVGLRRVRPSIHIAAAWLNGATGEIVIKR